MATPLSLLVIGGANLDLTGQATSALRAHDSNPGSIDASAGGVGRNIAENLARLGCKTQLLTMLGNDFGREVIIQSAQECGIDTTDTIISPIHATGTYLAITDHDGQLYVAINDMTIIDALTPEQLMSKRATLEAADALVIEANLPATTLQWISQHYSHKPLHADGVSVKKVAKLKPILGQLHSLKVNRDEARCLLEQSESMSDRALAQGLVALGVNSVLLSLGADGALLCTQNELVQQPVFNSEICADNGAGDALFAGFIAAQNHDQSAAEQLRFALGCAALTLSSAQAVSPGLSPSAVINTFLTD